VPIRERVAAGAAELVDEIADDQAPAVELLDQPLQCGTVGLVPFFRQTRGAAPKIGCAGALGPAQCRIKIFPSCNPGVDDRVGEDSAQRRIAEGPVAAVEAVALVDKLGLCFQKHKPSYVAFSVMC